LLRHTNSTLTPGTGEPLNRSDNSGDATTILTQGAVSRER